MLGRDTVRDARVKACPECGSRFAAAAEFCSFDGQPLTSTSWDPARASLVGSLVAGRYQVLEPLGEGGMGVVYKVQHVGLNRAFAMKVLRAKLAADARTAARFVQEAKATAAIKHPGVVSIIDFGDLDDGTPYLVMELLAGETLAERLKGRGALPAQSAALVAEKVASALGASHAAGVVHRDLKPDNVFLVGDGLGGAPESGIRIVDFGAAKVASSSKLTRPGMVFGTPHYMSPEQASGGEVDGRSDVYALGILLFEMLTGRVPFEADSFMGVVTLQMFTPPPRPSALVRGAVPPALEAVVLRALEKDPSARFPTMEAFAEAVRGAVRAPLLPRGPTVRMPDAPRHLAAPVPTPSDAFVVAGLPDRRSSMRPLVLGLVVGLSLVAAVVVVAVAARPQRPRSDPRAVVTGPAPVLTPAPTASLAPAASPAPAPAPTPSVAPAPVPPKPERGGRTSSPATAAASTRPPAADFHDPWRK